MHRWLRTEHLADDFERAFVDLLPHPLFKAAVRRMRKIVNGTQLNYVRDPGFYFTPEELSALYESNPRWAELELEVYGSLLSTRPVMAECWYIVDRRLRFLAASEAALSLWRRTREDLIGRAIVEVFPRAVGSKALETQRAALAAHKPRSFRTQSPTYERGVTLDMTPHPRGLKVRFDFDTGLPERRLP